MSNLVVTEIYKSIQGEAAYMGWPCIFVRLTGCPLRCKWCDTAYGFEGGASMSLNEILNKIRELDCNIVELTGGEPLAQDGAIPLMERLCKMGKKVLIETSGSEPIGKIPRDVHIIMDVKCPDSNMSDRNLWENLAHLKSSDELKFVVASREDFDWALATVEEKNLSEFSILFSPAWGLVKPEALADWVTNCGKNVRMQLQIHKYIWSPRAKGV